MSPSKKKPCIQKRIRIWLGEYRISVFTCIFVLFLWVTIKRLLGSDASLDFVTAFSAGVSGILMGFDLERHRRIGRENRDRKDLLRKLRNELERIEGQLGHANLLYPTVWKSAVSSGKLMLLSPEDLLKLNPVCNFVEGIEYEAKRLRDAKEDFMRTQNAGMELRWGRDSEIQIRREKQLQGRIQKLLQDEELWI